MSKCLNKKVHCVALSRVLSHVKHFIFSKITKILNMLCYSSATCIICRLSVSCIYLSRSTRFPSLYFDGGNILISPSLLLFFSLIYISRFSDKVSHTTGYLPSLNPSNILFNANFWETPEILFFPWHRVSIKNETLTKDNIMLIPKSWSHLVLKRLKWKININSWAQTTSRSGEREHYEWPLINSGH